eukprot:GHVN01037365.1.p1 GENE.GHVN01037365.1~~GHVN01037365.1.p1  ORF type:complete len:258 (+),score=19.43 GHVN01037365.1:249-1022(+)
MQAIISVMTEAEKNATCASAFTHTTKKEIADAVNADIHIVQNLLKEFQLSGTLRTIITKRMEMGYSPLWTTEDQTQGFKLEWDKPVMHDSIDRDSVSTQLHATNLTEAYKRGHDKSTKEQDVGEAEHKVNNGEWRDRWTAHKQKGTLRFGSPFSTKGVHLDSSSCLNRAIHFQSSSIPLYNQRHTKEDLLKSFPIFKQLVFRPDAHALLSLVAVLRQAGSHRHPPAALVYRFREESALHNRTRRFSTQNPQWNRTIR